MISKLFHHKLKRGWLLLFGILIAGLTAWLYFFPIWWEVRGHRLLVDWRRTKDSSCYDKIFDLLDHERFSKGFGDDVFEEMLFPEVYYRTNYPEGHQILVAIRNNGVALQRLSFQYKYEILFSNSIQDHIERTGNGPSRVDYLGIPAMLSRNGAGEFWKEGRYLSTVRLHYGLFKNGTAVYSFTKQFNLVIKVVPVSQFNGVKTISNPQLNKEMIEAFRFRYGGTSWIILADNNTTYDYPQRFPVFSVLCTNPPLDVAFRAKFVEESGMEFPSSGFSCIIKAGETKEVSSLQMPGMFQSLTGHHKGNWIFFTDPSLAYGDPLITNIWDGKLVFPVEFTIAPKNK